ncbi:MAG: metallophosphoesterase [Crenarchaeota archaeon]|nr:metallophosphoesterase [Thermoproteota archaeon]
MRILVISDIHDKFENVRKLKNIARDLTIVLGDFVEFGKPDIATVRRILEELGSQGETLYVPGNCDPREATQDLGIANTCNIHMRYRVVGDYVIVGYGGSNPTPFNTPLEFPEDVIERELESAVKEALGTGKKLIFACHAPPKDTAIDKIVSGAHVGSKAVRDLVEKYKPVLGLHGHIHEAIGMERLGDALVLNPGPLAWGRYVIVDFEGDRFSITFTSL